MQTLPTWILLWHWLTALLGVAAHAALALPLVTAFTLLAGRRENRRLCDFGGRELTRLNLALAAFWPAVLVSGVLLQLSPAQGVPRLPDDFSLWMPFMLPYSTAMLAWLGGVLCLFVQLALSRSAPAAAAGGAKRAMPSRTPRMRVGLAFLTALCFFAAQALPSCPFAGLPEGMTLTRAAVAVFTSSLHAFFTYFAPAGGFALLCLTLRPGLLRSWGCAEEDERNAARWCALWAMIGYMPFCLDRWGVTIGFALRPGAMPQAVAARVPELTALTLAVLCWVALFFRRAPRRLYRLNTLALLLLALGASAPFIPALLR